MTQIIVLLACAFVSFFGAKAAARHTKNQIKREGFNLQTASWGLSKLLGCIIVCGFLAGTLLNGPHALGVFIVSIVLTLVGQIIGMAGAGKK
jgi:predicted Co/Zn/Cd cation transporter (cation efflux family)